MNHSKYKKYIVVNENGMPMTFQKDQFYFAENEKRRRPLAVQIYSHEEATELIKKSVEFRLKHNFSLANNCYTLMPVGRKIKVRQ
jgi:hypothetical protein